MRNIGKSNQDAKIMMCYVHKHVLYTVDVPPNKFQVYLHHVWFLRPRGTHHQRTHELDSQWTSRRMEIFGSQVKNRDA